MDYIYLDNQKRAKSLLFVLVGLCLVFSIVTIIMFVTGSVMTSFIKTMLTVGNLSFIVLTLFFMLYLRRNHKDSFLLLLLHVIQFHLIFTSASVFVGGFSSFSFCVMHGILDSIVLMILYLFSFGKLHVVSAILLPIISIFLSIYQYDVINAIVMVVFSMIALLGLLKKNKKTHFLYGIIVVLVTFLASILTFVYGYEIVHVIMHYLINHAILALCLIVFVVVPLERTNDVNDEDEIEPTKSDNIVERAIDTADNTKELPEQQSLESIVEDQPQKQIEKKNRWIIKQYSNLPLEQLMDAPVDALWGISSEDKQLLKSAFNIKTVKDLATSKWFRMAEEIVDMANKQKD